MICLSGFTYDEANILLIIAHKLGHPLEEEGVEGFVIVQTQDFFLLKICDFIKGFLFTNQKNDT